MLANFSKRNRTGINPFSGEEIKAFCQLSH